MDKKSMDAIKQDIDAKNFEKTLIAAGLDGATAAIAAKGVSSGSPELLAAAFRSHADAAARKRQRAAEKAEKEVQQEIGELADLSNTFANAALQPGDDPSIYSNLLSEDELREIVESRNSEKATQTDMAKLEREVEISMGIYD